MSDLSYDRCPHDDIKVLLAEIGKNPDTDQSIELSLGGVASTVAIQSAILTLGTSMKAGHEKDFLDKIALTLCGKLTSDPHAICPLLTICLMCLLMLQNEGGVEFDEEGSVVITPRDNSVGPNATCMYNNDKWENDNGKDEGTLGGDGMSDGSGNGEGESDGEGIGPT